MSVFAPGTMQIAGSNPWGLSQSSWSASNFMFGERCRQVDFWESIYNGTSHNWKQADFDGNWVGQGSSASLAFTNAYRPFMGQSRVPFHVPLRQRRPTDPYRLGRLITNSFTALCLEGGFPELRTLGDPDSEDFIKALAQAQRMPTRLILARSLGGACGTVGLSWGFKHGRPFCRVHNAKHLYVHEWEDRDQLIPRHVTEVFRFTEPVFDPKERAVVDKWFWSRRDWTDVADVPFKVVPFEEGRDPVWEVDEENVSWHDPEAKGNIDDDAKECHFVWVQNLPSNDGPDGLPDYYGLEDSLETLDMLNSLISRSLGLNLDPTLVLSMDVAEWMANQSVKKGSENAIITGKGGSATYLELQGTSVTVGLARLKESTNQVLNAAQCILADPNEIAASGISSVALRTVYRPMTSKASIIREQYGLALTRMFEQQLRYCQRLVEAAKKVTAAQVPASMYDGEDENGQPMGAPDEQEANPLEALIGRDAQAQEAEDPDALLKEAMARLARGETLSDSPENDGEDAPAPEVDEDGNPIEAPAPEVDEDGNPIEAPAPEEGTEDAAGIPPRPRPPGVHPMDEDAEADGLLGPPEEPAPELTEADMVLAEREARAQEARIAVEVVFDLPPKVQQKPTSDGDTVAIAVPHVPGEARFIEVHWPDFFPDTPDDLAGKLTVLGTATGGKPVISQKTAVEQAAKALGVDPDIEWQRIDSENQKAAQQGGMGGMFPGMEDAAGGGFPPEDGGGFPPGGGEEESPDGEPPPDEEGGSGKPPWSARNQDWSR